MGSRTKKGTRKGKQQIKKSSVMSCYKVTNTFGKDFDEKVYKETNMTERYVSHFTQMMNVDKALQRDTPTGERLIANLIGLLKCIHNKDYGTTREMCRNECCIELRDSPLGGKGVFATKDIDVGTTCTMYPPNYLRITNGDFRVILDSSTDECVEQDVADEMADRLLDYKIGEDSGISVFGDPEFNGEWSMLGHMINDLSYNKTFHYDWDKGNVVYNKTGHIVNYMPIKKGEELSLHYDVLYWFKGGVKHPESRHSIHIG